MWGNGGMAPTTLWPCGDRPHHPQRSPKPHNWFRVGFAAGGSGGGLCEKVAKEEGKGETEREREGGGNGEGE